MGWVEADVYAKRLSGLEEKLVSYFKLVVDIGKNGVLEL